MRKRPMLFLPVLALIALPSPAVAEPGLPDTAAVASVLDAHPSVQAADARVESARAEARALRKGPHEFTFSGSYVRRSVDLDGAFNEYDAQLSRPFRLPGKARLDREIGDFGVEAAENLAEDMKHQAALLLANYWWDWLGAAGEAGVDRQAAENFEKLLSATQRRVELRDAAQLDADQAGAALAAARLAAEISSGREALARARLVAQFPDLPLPDAPPAIPQPEAADGEMHAYRDLIISNSHEIAAAQAEARRVDTVAERTRRDKFADPSVGLRLFSERNGAERGAGVVFSLPLGGGHRSALADRAASNSIAAQAELQAVRFDINETADADLAEARFRQRAWAQARQGLHAQMAALDKLRRGHSAGEIDLADVLYAERQVHDAFRAELMARADAMRALTKLRIDSHQLWIGD